MSWAASLPGAERFPECRLFFEEATCPGQLRCLAQSFFQKINVFLKKPLVPGNFAAWGRVFFSTKQNFKNSGTPVRRTRRRKSQQMHVLEFWDSCAQNKTSEISNKCTSRNSGTPGRRTKQQNVRNIKQCTFRSSGTPVRRTKRRKSKKMRC